MPAEVNGNTGPATKSYGTMKTRSSISHCSVDIAEESMKLEDQLTNDKLKQLELIFEEADEDGGGGLDMDEFRNAMRKAMGEHLTDHELDMMFMKVDTNCDGTVDWDEYLSYMLLEYRGKDDMNIKTLPKPLPKKLKKVPDINLYQRHHDSIIGVTYLPNVVKATSTLYRVSSDPSSGRYVTVTKEGVINYWNLDLVHLKSFVIKQDVNFQRKIGVWVTDFVCITNLNMICVATTSSTLSFYDMTANKFSLVLTISGLEICATCLDYHVDEEVVYNSQLLWGDARGNISGIVFFGCPTMCFLQPSINKHFQPKVEFKDISKGLFCGVRGYKLKDIHEDFVLRIKYFPVINSFLSCCRGPNTSLFQGDLYGKKALYFKVKKGVFAFDYCPHNNVLVTGGKDTVVRVWNPYVQSKPVMILQGHKSAILYVVVDDIKEQIISISEDKEINIFDMSTQICIQTIYRKWVPLGPRPITAMYFNKDRQALLVGTNQLAVFEHKGDEINTLSLTSHEKPVNIALYNELFHQVVSGGAESLVCVWDASTGEMVIQFCAHTMRTKSGETVSVEITSMIFDPSLRRLITASRDGHVKVWNFNNGACLRELEIFDDQEITSLVVARQRILTAGWNRQLTVYVDSSFDDSVLHMRVVHNEDIQTLALLEPGTIASGSYDGDIVIWSLDTNSPINLLNASESTGPLVICSRTSRKAMRTATEQPKYEEMSVSEDSKSKNSGAATDGSERFTATSNISSKFSQGTSNESYSEETNSSTKENIRRVRAKNTKSVEALLFLQTREVNRTSANLVSAGAEGWVRFWSIHPDGGLIGQFNAAHFQQDSITVLCTDSLNEMLITGDSEGYIKVWDIIGYCTERTLNKDDSGRLRESSQFLFNGDEMLGKMWRERRETFPPPPASSDPKRTVKSPPLLNSFRAHLCSIACIDYMSPDDKLISCGSDCSIRMWTIYGEFIGIFGQDIPWGRKKSGTKSSIIARSKSRMSDYPSFIKNMGNSFRKKDRPIPIDVRRVASATTLRVLCGGIQPGWRLAKNILTFWLPLLRQNKRDPDDQSRHHIQTERSVSQHQSVLESDTVKCPSTVDISTESCHLGKNFATFRNHKPLPKLPPTREFNNLCDVYGCLPICELEPIRTSIKPPQCLLEMRERQKHLMLKEPTHPNRTKTKAVFRLGTLPSKPPTGRRFTIAAGMQKGNSKQ